MSAIGLLVVSIIISNIYFFFTSDMDREIDRNIDPWRVETKWTTHEERRDGKCIQPEMKLLD